MNKKSTESAEKMLLSGKRIKECREDAGITQQKLTELIEALPENNGKTRNEKHISSLERGERSLSLEYARLISKVLRVREEYLLGNDDFKHGTDESLHKMNQFFKQEECIKYLIGSLGYREFYASETRFSNLIISSEDTEITIAQKIAFSKKVISSSPIRDVIIQDGLGRKIHIPSNEVSHIYDDICYFIKYRIEKEFDDITRYARSEDMVSKKST